MRALLVLASLCVHLAAAHADTLGLPPCTTFPAQWQPSSNSTGPGRVLVVRTGAEWTSFWRESGAEPPAVDFERWMVVGWVGDGTSRPRLIYRVSLDDALAARELVVRATATPFCDGKSSAGARSHLVLVPRSALPVRFVLDAMIDGMGWNAQNHGVDEHPLARVAGTTGATAVVPVVLREAAEHLARASLTAADVTRLDKNPFGHRAARYPDLWSSTQVSRDHDDWLVTYDGLTLHVDATTGRVRRVAGATPR